MKRLFLAAVVLFAQSEAWTYPTSLYLPYLRSTIKGLNALRTPSGLVADSAYVDDRCQLKILAHNTTPTNIGLDIMAQLDLAARADTHSQGIKNLRRIFTTLRKLKTHPAGLFFNLYSLENNTDPLNFEISSIDNLHLALAFFATMRLFPTISWGKTAASLFKRMDFAPFLDKDGEIGGLLHFNGEDWDLLPFRYTYWGSETRSLYTLLHPLGLVAHQSSAPYLPTPKEKYKTPLDTFLWQGNKLLIKTYDGGAFQLYLPQLILGEDQFVAKDSPISSAFDNYSDYGIENALSFGYELPAIFTASNRGIEIDAEGNYKPDYNGRAGSAELAANESDPLHNPPAQDVVSPHGVFMAATRNPSKYLPWIKNMEFAPNLYCKDLGFLDGYYILGENRGQVVHSQLALDQEMTLLSLIRILTHDNQTAVSRVLFKENDIQKTLPGYFKDVNALIRQATPTD